MSKVDKLHVAILKQNVGQIANLTLNHGGMPELPTLIAHNFRFFGEFSKLHVLDKLLSFRRSCRTGVGSKVKKLYISDVNRYLSNKHCHRYIRGSSDFKPSRAYTEEEFPEEYRYYVSKTEGCAKTEPGVFEFGYNDMKMSELYVLPKPLKKDVCRVKNDIEEIEIQDILDHPEDDDPGMPPEHGVKVYKKDYTELEKSMLWLEDNKERISIEYDELCIAEFMMKDVNRANRLALHVPSLVSQLEGHAKTIGMLFGEAVREKYSDPFGEKEYGRNLERLVHQIKEMAGVEMEDLSDEVKLKILPYRNRLTEINEELKKVKTDVLAVTKLNGEAARLRMKIKDLFNDYAYLSDEILCRNTYGQCAINISEYLQHLNSYKCMTEIATGDNPHNLTFWERNCLPEIGDLSIGKNMDELKKKSKITGQRFIDKYSNAKYLALRTMGRKWVDIMEKYYPVSLDKEAVLEVETDVAFEKLKEKFIKNMNGVDLEADLKIDPLVGMRDSLVGLNYILNRDHSFIKRLPAAFDENFSNLMAEFKRNLYYLNNESADAFYLTLRNYRHFPMLDYVGEKKEAEFAKDLALRSKNKYPAVEPTVRGNWKMAEEGGVDFRTRGRGGMFLNGVLGAIKQLSYILGDELKFSPVEMNIAPTASHVFDEKKPLPPKQNYMKEYTYVFKKNYREVLNSTPKILEEQKELSEKEELVANLLEKVKFCTKEDALDDNYDVLMEETYNLGRKHKNDERKIKVRCSKRKIQTPSDSLLCENRFSVLYSDPTDVKESEEVARMILSTSDNMEVIFDWAKYKAAKKEASFVRKHMSENLEKDNYCKLLQKVAYRNRSNTYTKYRCNGIEGCIVVLLLCYKKRLVPDLKYLKETYGLQRRQLRHLIKNLTSVCRLLNDKIKIARFTNIPIKF